MQGRSRRSRGSLWDRAAGGWEEWCESGILGKTATDTHLQIGQLTDGCSEHSQAPGHSGQVDSEISSQTHNKCMT